MIVQTPQQRANTVEALEVMWPSVPPRNVARGLSTWREGFEEGRPTCGTVACFGGWCAWWPPFRKQGVIASYQAPSIGDTVGYSAARVLFADEILFMPRDRHPADDDFTGTDHALVTNRLRWLLANSVVTAIDDGRTRT